MAWNGSDGGVGNSTQRTPSARDAKNAKVGEGVHARRVTLPSGASRTSAPTVRGLVALAIVVVGGGLAWWLVTGRGNGGGHEPQMPKGRGAIAVARPSFVPRVAPAVAVETNKRALDAPPVPVGNVMTARTAKTGRVMTLMDGTVVTNRSEIPFKRDLEHSLWVALRPGNMGAGLLTTLQNRHSEQEIVQMLKEKTVPEPGDSEGMVRIKQEVQELKERILSELDSGRSLADVLDEIRNQGIAESKIHAETMRLRAEAIRSGDPQGVRDTVRRVNELRSQQGLEPLSVPAEFQGEAAGDEPTATQSDERTEF